jgi:hypothetical protein
MYEDSGPPPSGYRGDDDLCSPQQCPVDSVDQVRPIADQRELRVPSALKLLGLPGDDPHQLVLRRFDRRIPTAHGHAEGATNLLAQEYSR